MTPISLYCLNAGMSRVPDRFGFLQNQVAMQDLSDLDDTCDLDRRHTESYILLVRQEKKWSLSIEVGHGWEPLQHHCCILLSLFQCVQGIRCACNLQQNRPCGEDLSLLRQRFLPKKALSAALDLQSQDRSKVQHRHKQENAWWCCDMLCDLAVVTAVTWDSFKMLYSDGPAVRIWNQRFSYLIK